MIVQDGKVVAAWGDPARKVRVNSVRKSLLSALYGIAIADGRIDPAKTLRALSIDDKPPSLTAAERTATVQQLLAARSGVYHEAAAEPPSMKAKRPDRGSHAPGTYWYYNNWDFNALGTIYRQEAKEDIFKAFETRVARPVGMQDFTVADGKYIFARVSDHPAYHFNVSARDLARFGLLYLNRGQWNGRQVVPASWVDESTAVISDVDRGIGYGYMWWPSRNGAQHNVPVGPGTYSARGFGSQFLLVAPARNLVIAHLHADQMKEDNLAQLLRLIMQAAPTLPRR
jgi:CubicO group peptidase (beta-lactamase class C family)